MSDRTKVQKKLPGAKAELVSVGGNKKEWRIYHDDGCEEMLVGVGRTPNLAWADAVKVLQEPED